MSLSQLYFAGNNNYYFYSLPGIHYLRVNPPFVNISIFIYFVLRILKEFLKSVLYFTNSIFCSAQFTVFSPIFHLGSFHILRDHRLLSLYVRWLFLSSTHQCGLYLKFSRIHIRDFLKCCSLTCLNLFQRLAAPLSPLLSFFLSYIIYSQAPLI